MRRARTAVGVIGIAATLLLHSLFFVAAIWGGRAPRMQPRPPDSIGAGANVGEVDAEPGERRMTVMLTMDLEAEAPALEPAPQLPEPAMHQPAVLEITGPDVLPLPPIELPGEAAAELDAQLMARAQYAGVYESQVRARIMRAWQAPDELAPIPEFSCLVQIHQRHDGHIREVALVLAKCNGSPAWQQSLVDAIQVSSPLPAPPHPSVFVDSFSLVFHSSAMTTPRTSSR